MLLPLTLQVVAAEAKKIASGAASAAEDNPKPRTKEEGRDVAKGIEEATEAAEAADEAAEVAAEIAPEDMDGSALQARPPPTGGAILIRTVAALTMAVQPRPPHRLVVTLTFHFAHT